MAQNSARVAADTTLQTLQADECSSSTTAMQDMQLEEISSCQLHRMHLIRFVWLLCPHRLLCSAGALNILFQLAVTIGKLHNP